MVAPLIAAGSIAAGIGAGASLGSGILSGLFGRSAADKAFNRQVAAMKEQWMWNKLFYENRYKWMMEDMRRAGLNPILAASSGFSTGGSPSVSLPHVTPAKTPDFNLASSARDIVESHTSTAHREKALKDAEAAAARAQESLAHAAKLRAEKGLVTAQEKKTLAEIDRIQAEIHEKLANWHLLEQKEAESYERTTLLQKEQSKIAIGIRSLLAQVYELERVGEIYKGKGGKYLAWAKEVAKVIGIPLGMLFGAKTLKGMKGQPKGRDWSKGMSQ